MPTFTPVVRQDRVRFAVLIRPKSGLPVEEFDRYWLEVHGRLFMSIAIATKNLLKYEQFHLNNSLDETVAAMGARTSPFRGMIIFEAESMEKILEIFADPEYLRLVEPDEQNFFNRAEAQVLAGELATFFDFESRALKCSL